MMKSELQMKKTPSPLIIRPGHVRKLKVNSPAKTTENYTHKNHHNSKNPPSSYIKSTARKISGFFSAFRFWRRKANRDQVHTLTRDYQAGESSCSLSSSNYDASPEVDTAQIKSSLNFEEIYKATGSFSAAHKIGEGGFGTVYRGQLKNGSVVAVKRAKKETYDQCLSAEFKNEIKALSNIGHQNLVRFYGYIEHRDEKLIVVEFVGNGNLREHLDGTCGSGLEIAELLDIAIDVAHAITYLHTYADTPIIHRDIKSSNILITEKLRAKVADFGFARLAAEDPSATHISTQVKGTAGYLDPEYLRTYQVTEKSDVYSFGVVLVEMVTGRYPIESRRRLEERITTRWALRILKDREVVMAMDPRLRRSVASVHIVERVLKLARQCLAPSRRSRPSMRKCVETLWEIRKEFREKNFTNSLINSASVAERHAMFGIEHSGDGLMFASA